MHIFLLAGVLLFAAAAQAEEFPRRVSATYYPSGSPIKYVISVRDTPSLREPELKDRVAKKKLTAPATSEKKKVLAKKK